MHQTLERVQTEATPIISGPLAVYLTGICLIVTVTTGQVTTHILAAIIFASLTAHAIGREYVSLIQYPIWFLAPSLILITIITPGKAIMTLWHISISTAGVRLAFETGLRSVASLTILFFLAFTTTVPQLVTALNRLWIPDPIIELLLLSYRAVQVLLDETLRLSTAATLRGGQTSRYALFRTTKRLAASLLIRSIDRAERVEMAMQARGYHGEFPMRTQSNRGYIYSVGIILLLVMTGFGGLP
jgi:cobalt/nickel transport system permease protein